MDRFEDSEVFLFHAVVARLDRLAEGSVLPPWGLTYPEFEFLLAVGAHEGQPQGLLADRLLLGKSAVSQRASGLVARGLVEQLPYPDTKREKLVRLTDQGRGRLAHAQKALVAAAEPALAGLGDRRRGLADALAAVHRALRASETNLIEPGEQR